MLPRLIVTIDETAVLKKPRAQSPVNIFKRRASRSSATGSKKSSASENSSSKLKQQKKDLHKMEFGKPPEFGDEDNKNLCGPGPGDERMSWGLQFYEQ